MKAQSRFDIAFRGLLVINNKHALGGQIWIVVKSSVTERVFQSLDGKAQS